MPGEMSAPLLSPQMHMREVSLVVSVVLVVVMCVHYNNGLAFLAADRMLAVNLLGNRMGCLHYLLSSVRKWRAGFNGLILMDFEVWKSASIAEVTSFLGSFFNLFLLNQT